MHDILVRGVSRINYQTIQILAKEQNLSINQEILKLIDFALNEMRQKNKKEFDREKIFLRMEKLRKEIAVKYPEQEDSVKIIREMRAERMRRYE